MIYRDEIINEIRKQYPYLSKEIGIRRIGILGSTVKGPLTKNGDREV